jgi:hypothetical protein
MTDKKLIPFLFLVLSLFFVSYSLAAQVHFQWGASSGVVEGYRIYYGSSHQGPYPNLLVEVGGTTTDYTATLDEGLTYYLVVRAYNSYGESGNSNEIKWPSVGDDTTPPGDVSGFTATPGSGQITLTWTNPTDTDFAGAMIRYRTDGTYPQDKDDGSPIPNGNDGKISGSPNQNMSYVHTNLDPTTHYYYSAFSYDTSNNYSQTAHADAQPLPPSNHDPVIESFTAIPSSLNNPGETTTFNVSATDPDGDSLTYTINFGDGTANGSGSQVVHTYKAQGIYTAEVSVDDGNGHIVSESLQVTVDDIPPAEPTNVSAN